MTWGDVVQSILDGAEQGYINILSQEDGEVVFQCKSKTHVVTHTVTAMPVIRMRANIARFGQASVTICDDVLTEEKLEQLGEKLQGLAGDVIPW